MARAARKRRGEGAAVGIPEPPVDAGRSSVPDRQDGADEPGGDAMRRLRWAAVAHASVVGLVLTLVTLMEGGSLVASGLVVVLLGLLVALLWIADRPGTT